MKLKNISLLAATFTFAFSNLQAQNAPKVEYIDGMKVVAIDIPAGILQQAPDSRATNYVKKGYCEDEIRASAGFGEKEELGAAIYIPREALGVYKDAKVAGLRIGLGAEASNLTAFLIEGKDFTSPYKLSTKFPNTLNIGLHNMMFRVPYPIQNDLIVGYFSTGKNQLGMDGAVTHGDACYVNRKGEWGSIYQVANKNKWGSLSIQLLLTGENMPENEMAIGEILTKHAEQGKPFTLLGIASNETTKSAVENYEVTCSFDNGYSTSQIITKHLEAGQIDTFKIAIDPQIRYGSPLATVEITKVNGETDSDPSNNATMKVINIVEKGCYFPRMVVAEETTNTACGFCPRGLVVLESMKKRYPDTFIGISIHTDAGGFSPDAMHSASYNNITGYLAEKGLPNGIVNRKKSLSGDPLKFERYYDMEKEKLSEARVIIRSVSDVQNKDGQKIIHVETETTFSRDIPKGNYKLAYILIENGISDKQQNGYANGAIGSMAGWESKPSVVLYTFNDVAREIWDLSGMDNSLPTDIKKKTVYKHSFDMPLPKTVLNEKNLEVVVLVLNNSAGDEIIQAARLGIAQETSIATPAITQDIDGWNIYAENRTVKMLGIENANISVYNMDGRQVKNENLSNGIYLVRATANGKTMTRKVVIR